MPPIVADNSPDWRWRWAAAYVEAGRRIPRSCTDAVVRRAHSFLRRWKAARTEPDDKALRREFPDIHAAHAIYAAADRVRWIVEAGILADQSPETLGAYLDVPAAVVESYEGLFFDIRRKLKARGYILGRIIYPDQSRFAGGADDGRILKAIAYSAGWSRCVEFLDEDVLSSEARVWMASAVEDELLRRAWLAAHRLAPDDKNALGIVGLAQRLAALDSAAPEGDATETKAIVQAFLESLGSAAFPAPEQRHDGDGFADS